MSIIETTEVETGRSSQIATLVPVAPRGNGNKEKSMAEAAHYQFQSMLGRPLGRGARLVMLALIVPVLLSFTQPLWQISLKAPQYPEGLTMDIYSYKLTGGHDGQDINEINELNHYIGMKKIEQSDFADLDWMPFAFGVLVLLALRAAAIGTRRSLIDLSVLSIYTALFSGGRFIYRMYVFGHTLDPHAAVKIQPFMPVILGTKQLANFVTHGVPQMGTYLIGIYIVGLVALTLHQSVGPGRERGLEIK